MTEKHYTGDDLAAAYKDGYIKGGLIAALASSTQPSAVQPNITLDFKQTTELLEMFGGEPAELTLQVGDGHSGKGLYVHHTSYPEEGAEYLGVADEEAVPCVTGNVTNLLGYKVLERTIYRLEKRQENSGRPDEELNALKELFAALTPSSKQEDV